MMVLKKSPLNGSPADTCSKPITRVSSAPSSRYLVSEAQKAEIAACLRETLQRIKPLVFVAMVLIPAILIGSIFWFATRSGTLNVTVVESDGRTTSYSQPIGLSGSDRHLAGTEGWKYDFPFQRPPRRHDNRHVPTAIRRDRQSQHAVHGALRPGRNDHQHHRWQRPHAADCKACRARPARPRPASRCLRCLSRLACSGSIMASDPCLQHVEAAAAPCWLATIR